jgi:hypothetical protein
MEQVKEDVKWCLQSLLAVTKTMDKHSNCELDTKTAIELIENEMYEVGYVEKILRHFE